jgi:hypothetical protein
MKSPAINNNLHSNPREAAIEDRARAEMNRKENDIA